MMLCAASLLAAVMAPGCPAPDLPDLAGIPKPASTSGTAPGSDVPSGEGAAPPTSPDPPSGPCTTSWYGEQHRGLTTASGQPFDPDAMTVAAWDYDFGQVLEVTYEGQAVEVEVTDRGPARRLGRCLDLSAAAFSQLADTSVGLIEVTYTEVGR